MMAGATRLLLAAAIRVNIALNGDRVWSGFCAIADDLKGVGVPEQAHFTSAFFIMPVCTSPNNVYV